MADLIPQGLVDGAKAALKHFAKEFDMTLSDSTDEFTIWDHGETMSISFKGVGIPDPICDGYMLPMFDISYKGLYVRQTATNLDSDQVVTFVRDVIGI